MKTIILPVLVALLFATSTQAAPYQPPTHNYYQNNWLGGGD